MLPVRSGGWAAAALPYCTWSLLGLKPDALNRSLAIVRQVLPASIDWIELNRQRVGDATLPCAIRASFR
jgi:hypothetical protein